MTITSLQNIIDGLQLPTYIAKQSAISAVAGRPITYWAATGVPSAGSYNGTLNGATLDSSSTPVTGQIPYRHPPTGNSHIAQVVYDTLIGTTGGTFLLCDRLWHNGGFTITSTSAQSITSPTWPARDENGATDGVGVILAVEVSAVVGAGTPTITVTYTNSAGTGSRTATNIIATVASAPAATTYFIGLQSGDVGVRSVQSLTLSATWTSGTINLVALRPLCLITRRQIDTLEKADFISLGLPKTYSGTVPYLIYTPIAAGNQGFSAILNQTFG